MEMVLINLICTWSTLSYFFYNAIIFINKVWFSITVHILYYSAAAILKKSLILRDTPTRGITRYHLCNLKQKNVYFLESVVVVK